MGEGSKWTPGKIFLIVIGALAGLGILCCGGGYLFLGDKIKNIFSVGKDVAEFVQRIQKEFGPTAAFQPIQNGDAKFILAVGVDGDLTPERVVQVQDATWKIFAETFAKDGFAAVTHVAVGRPDKSARSGRGHGAVADWSTNMIAAAELVKRTGIAAPPVAAFLPGNDVVVVNVTTGDDKSDDTKPQDAKPKDEKKDKEGDGDGGK